MSGRTGLPRFLVLGVMAAVACSPQPETSSTESPRVESIAEEPEWAPYASLEFLTAWGGPGTIDALTDLPVGFWEQDEIPIGGARMIEGKVVWIESTGEGRNALVAFDGIARTVLLQDRDWPLPMLRLGLAPRTGGNLWLLYCCTAFGGGCVPGPVFELDFEASRARILVGGPSDQDLARDFPLGVTVTYRDERWFAFSGGQFWARVPRNGGPPQIVTYDGVQLVPRFEALFAGDPNRFPIGDELFLLPSGRILYVNRSVSEGLDTREETWFLVSQDAERGRRELDLSGSWSVIRTTLVTLGGAELPRVVARRFQAEP